MVFALFSRNGIKRELLILVVFELLNKKPVFIFVVVTFQDKSVQVQVMGYFIEISRVVVAKNLIFKYHIFNHVYINQGIDYIYIYIYTHIYICTHIYFNAQSTPRGTPRGIFVPQQGMEPIQPALRMWSYSCQTAREILDIDFL